MTARELLSLVLRRWYVMGLGAAVSMGALMLVWSQPGLYFTRFEMVLLAPLNADNPNNVQDPHYALAPIAGVVVADVTKGHLPMLTASTETTLYGEGVRRGWRVRLPNTGSQWVRLYDQPRIDVQVVDPDPETVQREADRVRAALRDDLAKRQEEMGVAPTMRVTMISAPGDPIIGRVSGSRTRAAVVLAVVGASLTTVVVVLLEQLVQWRRVRRRARTGATS